MLVDPNLNSPANIDAAVHLKNDPEGWKKKARRFGRIMLTGRRIPIVVLKGLGFRVNPIHPISNSE